MAKAQGFICDVCESFETVTNGNRPRGWMRLNVATENPDDGFDICSNKCLANLGKERYKAERETSESKKGVGSALAEDGLTRLPGSIHSAIHEWYSETDILSEVWGGSFIDGFRREAGRGYTWICDLDDKQSWALADRLDNMVSIIRANDRAQTQEEKNFIEACTRYVPVLRSVDG